MRKRKECRENHTTSHIGPVCTMRLHRYSGLCNLTDFTGLDWSGLDCIAMDRIGLDRTGPDWAGLD